MAILVAIERGPSKKPFSPNAQSQKTISGLAVSKPARKFFLCALRALHRLFLLAISHPGLSRKFGKTFPVGETMKIRKRKSRLKKTMTPKMEVEVVEVRAEVFAIADTPGPLRGGWYWQAADYQLLRGPFSTTDEAGADAEHIAKQLVPVILAPDDKDDAETKRLKIAADLIAQMK